MLLCFPFFVIGGALAQQQSLAQATVGASFFSNDPKVLLVFQLLGALRIICAVYLFAHLLKKKATIETSVSRQVYSLSIFSLDGDDF